MRKNYKFTAIAAMLCLALNSNAQTSTLFNTWESDSSAFSVGIGQAAVLYGLSANGEYAVGYGDVSLISLLWQKDGNVLTDMVSADEDITSHGDCLVNDVSNSGIAVGTFYSKDNKNIIDLGDGETMTRYIPLPGYRTMDGTWHNAELLIKNKEGEKHVNLGSGGAAGNITRISGDGSIMGGFVQSADGKTSVPALWNKEGELIQPMLPITNSNHFRMTAMSEDASVIGGYKARNTSLSAFTVLDGVIYTNGAWADIDFTYPEGTEFHQSWVKSISDNGAYACGYVLYDVGAESFAKGYIYDVKANKYTWIDGILPTTVTNDGTLYGRDHYDDFIGQTTPAIAVMYKDGEVKNVKEWLIANYALSAEATAELNFSDITGVSEPVYGYFTITGHCSKGGGQGGAEKNCDPFVITLCDHAPAAEEYVTTELGTVVDNDKVKVNFFDGQMTASGNFESISGNGKYLTGFAGGTSFVYDREALTLRRLNYPPTSNGSAQECYAYGISNDGTVVGSFVCKDSLTTPDDGSEACRIAGVYKNGEWHPLNRIAGVPLTASGMDGTAAAITPDGSIIAGRVSSDYFEYTACRWSSDGKITSLLPGCDKGSGGMIKSISDDGNIAAGWIYDSNYGQPVIWIGNEIFYLNDSQDYVGTAFFVSHNGKYVVGQASLQNQESEGPTQGFIYNTETKKVTFNEKCNTKYDSNAITGISEDGKVVVGFSYVANEMLNRKPFIIIDGEFYDLDDYMKGIGFTAPTKYNGLNFFTPGGVSQDGKVIYGICDDSGMRLAYVIELKNVVTGIDGITSDGGNATLSSTMVGDNLKINGNYTSATVYNAAGACIINDTKATGSINVSGLAANNLYIVKVMSGNTVKTFKVIKK